MIVVLGLDPAFRHFGWCVTRSDAERDDILALGVIRPKKSKTKGVLARDDNHRCGTELARELLAIAKQWGPDIICAEALNVMPPRMGARIPTSATSKSGRAWGLVDMLCVVLGVPLLQVAPQTIKKKVTGDPMASKHDVIRALNTRTDGELLTHLMAIRAKTMWEHPADALGAIVALRDDVHLRLVRNGLAPVQPELSF